MMLLIIENDELKPNDHHLTTTNVFILFKHPKPEDHADQLLVELRNFKLSKSCRKFSIKFRGSSDFDIFQEFQDISLNEKPLIVKDSDEVEDGVWYQSKTFVRGFKDGLVNEQSIWN